MARAPHLEPKGSAHGTGFDWAITDHQILGAQYTRKQLSNRGTDSFGAITIFSGVDTELSVVQDSLKYKFGEQGVGRRSFALQERYDWSAFGLSASGTYDADALHEVRLGMSCKF